MARFMTRQQVILVLDGKVRRTRFLDLNMQLLLCPDVDKIAANNDTYMVLKSLGTKADVSFERNGQIVTKAVELLGNEMRRSKRRVFYCRTMEAEESQRIDRLAELCDRAERERDWGLAAVLLNESNLDNLTDK